MPLRIETGLLNPDTAQYAGKGQKRATIADIATEARRIEALGFDGVCAPEAGHDPFLPARRRRGAHVARPARHQRRDRVSAEPDGHRAAGVGPAAALRRPLQPRPRHAGEGPQRAPLLDAVDGGAGPAPPRVRALPAGDLRELPGREADAVRGEALPLLAAAAVLQPRPDRPSAAADLPRGREPLHVEARAASSAPASACTRSTRSRYTKDVVVPAIAAGAAKAGRTLADVDLVGAPFLAIGADEGEVAEGDAGAQAARRRSTRRRAPTTRVLAHHGWEDVGLAAPPPVARGQVAGDARPDHRRHAEGVGDHRHVRPARGAGPRALRRASSRPCCSTCRTASSATRTASATSCGRCIG